MLDELIDRYGAGAVVTAHPVMLESGRTVIFYLRSTRFGPSNEIHDGDQVAHIELTTREEARARGAECQDAVIFA